MEGRGRAAVVTGANRGLGFAIARGLAEWGAHAVLAGRDGEALRAAATTIEATTPGAEVSIEVCDLARPASIAAAAEALCNRFSAIDLLIHNAGIVPLRRELAATGVELGWQVHVLGPAQLTDALLPRLRAAPQGRIIQLSGIALRRGDLRLDDLAFAKRPWDWQQAIADAQLARAMLTHEWAVRLADTRITANSVHPGPVRTGAMDGMPAWMRLLADTVLKPAFRTPERAAKPILWLATDPGLAQVSGKFYHRWHAIPAHPLLDDVRQRAALWDHTMSRILEAGSPVRLVH